MPTTGGQVLPLLKETVPQQRDGLFFSGQAGLDTEARRVSQAYRSGTAPMRGTPAPQRERKTTGCRFSAAGGPEGGGRMPTTGGQVLPHYPPKSRCNSAREIPKCSTG
jgi:hypothetical protein